MRDRLIEVIAKSNLVLVDGGIHPDTHQAQEALADHLLAEGVIVPPCKVGDKVYRIVGDGSILAWDIVSMECYVDEIGFVDDSDNWIAFDNFGNLTEMLCIRKRRAAELQNL
jgi:hypothetical protein